MNAPQALVFTAGDDEPTLLVRNVDIQMALESTWITDIRTYHLHAEDPAKITAAILEEKGIRDGRIGVDLETAAVTGAYAFALAGAFAPAKIEDATFLLGDLRLIKSPAEVAYLREAATHARAGLDSIKRAFRAGRTEIAVAADVEYAVRQSGSDYPAIPTEFSTGVRGAAGHAAPRPKLIERGELGHFEFAGVSARYHTTAITTVVAGEPGPRAREIYDLNVQSLQAGIAAIKPGVPVAEIEERSLDPLRKLGLESYAMMRFGYGIGVAYPPIWLETLQIDRQSKQTLEPGMVFVLHACIELVDEGLGAIQGGTYLMTDTGLEMLVGEGDAPLAVL
jgi:Xaa-Pro aminopeptidase